MSTPPDGKRIRLQAGGFRTEADLTAWFTDAMHLLGIPEDGPAGHAERVELLALIRESRRRKHGLPSYEDMQRRHSHGAAFRAGTTGEYLTGWLDERGRAGDLEETTLNGYRTHVARMLPSFGDVPLDKLRSQHISKFFAGRRERPAAGKRPKARVWTPERVAAWRAAYEEASEGMTRKADKRAVWKRVDMRPSPVMVWTVEQTGQFLDAIVPDRLYALWHLIVFRGPRRGEATGLRWVDIDLDTAVASIETQVRS